jgi:hypothetical protein
LSKIRQGNSICGTTVSRTRPPVSALAQTALLVIDAARLIINDEFGQLTIFPSVSYKFHLGEASLRGLTFPDAVPRRKVSETDVP